MLSLKIKDKKYLLKLKLVPEITGDEVLIKESGIWGSFGFLYKKQIETGCGVLEYIYVVYISRLDKTSSLIELEDLFTLDPSKYRTYSKETLNELFEEMFFDTSLEKEYKKLVKDTVRFSKHIKIDSDLAEQIAEELYEEQEQESDCKEYSPIYKTYDFGGWSNATTKSNEDSKKVLVYENSWEQYIPFSPLRGSSKVEFRTDYATQLRKSALVALAAYKAKEDYRKPFTTKEDVEICIKPYDLYLFNQGELMEKVEKILFTEQVEEDIDDMSELSDLLLEATNLNEKFLEDIKITKNLQRLVESHNEKAVELRTKFQKIILKGGVV